MCHIVFREGFGIVGSGPDYNKAIRDARSHGVGAPIINLNDARRFGKFYIASCSYKLYRMIEKGKTNYLFLGNHAVSP